MKIPKYVQNLMERSKYEFDCCTTNENYAVGYTIRIRKESPYTKIDTFKKEVGRLVTWANRTAGVDTAYILRIPEKTHYCNQTAIVTIFDPVMMKLEQFISNK